MITRRTFIGTLAGCALAAPFSAEAQQLGKVYRIGLLGTTAASSAGPQSLWGTFLQGLRDLGYVEGQNLVVELRYAPEGEVVRLPELAADLVRLNVDVIVAGGSLTPHVAKRATATIPIVITNHGDPVGSGLVASLARPGGNVTGLSLLSSELVGKQLQLLKEVSPRIVRVAVLWNPTSQTHPRMLSEAEGPARALGFQLQRVQARGTDDYERAFVAMTRERAEALLPLGDPIFWGDRTRLVELAIKRRLPAIFPQREYVEAGGLMGYGANLHDNMRRAAAYVDKILKGARPADLPVDQPTKFELVINVKTAKTLGLTIPPSVLLRADEVIQ